MVLVSAIYVQLIIDFMYRGRVSMLSEGLFHRLLLETMSVADNVMAIADQIYDDIEDKVKGLDDSKWEDRGDYELYMNTLHFTYTFYGQPLHVYCEVKRFDDYSEHGRLFATYKYLCWKMLQSGTQAFFNKEHMAVCIGVVLVNGVLQRKYEQRLLVHELEHAYQYIRQKIKNPNINSDNTKLYMNSTTHLSSDSDDVAKVKRLLYILNPMEQDAFLQSYYFICKDDYDNFNDFKSTELGGLFGLCEEGMEILKRKINDDNNDDDGFFDKYMKCGYSPQRLLSYCEKQYNRFYKKFMKIYGRLKMEWDKKNSNAEGVVENIKKKLRRL